MSKPWSTVDDAELSRLRECERLLRMICDDMDVAVTVHANPDAGGQHTNGRCCPFGNVFPGTLSVFSRWVREIKEYL